MALIQEAMQGPQMQGPQEPAQAQQPAASQADPQQIENYQRLGLAVMRIIYDKNVTAQLVQIIGQVRNPAEAIVRIARGVVEQVQQKMKGVEPGFANTILPVAVALLYELAEAAGLVKWDPKMLQQMIAMVKQGGMATAPSAPAAPATEGEGPVETQAANEEVEA